MNGSVRSFTFRGFPQGAEMETASFNKGDVGNIQNKIENALISREILFEWEDNSPRPAFLFLGHDLEAPKAAFKQLERLVKESDNWLIILPCCNFQNAKNARNEELNTLLRYQFWEAAADVDITRRDVADCNDGPEIIDNMIDSVDYEKSDKESLKDTLEPK